MKLLEKFFGRSQETKQNYNSKSLSLKNMSTSAVWSQYNYNSFCLEAYRKNPIAYSCIRMTVDGAARIPLKLYKNNTSLQDHPVLKLLQTPNNKQNGFALRSELLSALQISGNSYLKIITDKYKKHPLALYPLRSDRVHIETTASGRIAHYTYAPSGSAHKNIIPTDHIMHLKYYSADDDYYGQAPLYAAMRSNDIHNKIADFQKSLLDNSARPSGCLVYHGTHNAPNLTKDQFERLKSELEENYIGASAAGRPMILEGGLDWKTMSLSPADMEFAELRHQTAREIALCFGVPPMMLGIPGDNTYSNYSEAIKVFTRNTLIPMSEKLCDALSQKLSHFYGDLLTLKPDIDALPAFLPERESHRNFIANASFLSDEQKYKLLFS